MSAPIALVKASAYSSPPTNNTEYGKGDFLVGFFGEEIKYSKDGQIWYKHPKHYDWAKGNYAELDDVTLNDVNKTIDFSSSPIFINSLRSQIQTTATSGTRRFAFSLISSETNSLGYNSIGASITHSITFGEQHTEESSNDQFNSINTLPRFWGDIPFHEKIKFNDSMNVDTNDDIKIYLKGVYALPKYHWIEFKNCKNFQVEKVVESLADGVFSGTKPHSLKILKI